MPSFPDGNLISIDFVGSSIWIVTSGMAHGMANAILIFIFSQEIEQIICGNYLRF
jgi:hypothetical protein